MGEINVLNVKRRKVKYLLGDVNHFIVSFLQPLLQSLSLYINTSTLVHSLSKLL